VHLERVVDARNNVSEAVEIAGICKERSTGVMSVSEVARLLRVPPTR